AVPAFLAGPAAPRRLCPHQAHNRARATPPAARALLPRLAVGSRYALTSRACQYSALPRPAWPPGADRPPHSGSALTSRVTGHAPRPPRRGLSCLDWPCAAGTPSRGALPVLRSPGPVRATSTATGRLLGVLLLTGGRQVLGPVRALPSRPTGRGRLWPVPGACAGAPRASAGACKAA